MCTVIKQSRFLSEYSCFHEDYSAKDKALNNMVAGWFFSSTYDQLLETDVYTHIAIYTLLPSAAKWSEAW